VQWRVELSIYVLRVLVMRQSDRQTLGCLIHNICHYEMWERVLIYEGFSVKKFAETVVSDVWSLCMQMRVDVV